MKYCATSMYRQGLPRFRVEGGPFAVEQSMGWHITNEKGYTTGVSCDHEFAERLNASEAFLEFLSEHNVRQQLEALFSGERREALVALMDKLEL